MAKILIVDDDRNIRKALSLFLEKSGHTVESSSNLHEGIKKSEKGEFEVVFLDVSLPDGSGLELLPQFKSTLSRPEVIIITGDGDPDGAELAIRSGAWDYIEKPLSFQHISLPLNRALEFHTEKQASAFISSFNRQEIVGNSPQINESIFLAARAASSGSNTLITGETGTGKELFAKAIHENSSRRLKNFVVVDCAALPKNLVETTLFGYEKGSFTGADKMRSGLVKLAHGGTLFLDEIGELHLSMQKAFLRVLQERTFRTVGGKEEIASDFRLISATNRDLEGLVDKGEFRQDLLFRLRTINIELPPLRKRDGDITVIANQCIRRMCEMDDMPVKAISRELLTALSAHPWPGNVREFIGVLENVLAAAETSSILYPDHLPVSIRANIAKTSVKSGKKIRSESGPDTSAQINEDQASLTGTFKQYRENIIQDAENRYLVQLMNSTEWNIKEACKVADLSRPRLYALLKKYDISRANS